jgi:hypothetical protein
MRGGFEKNSAGPHDAPLAEFFLASCMRLKFSLFPSFRPAGKKRGGRLRERRKKQL